MISASYRIEGGDFAQAGGASRSLKEQLKRLGVDPEVVRRAMIAAYEAEMNVVIHADRGTFWARVSDGRLDVEVVDEGPGILDIERAMEPGYSTAGPAARALGFGAGLGLPNIRKNSDRFSIDSEIGQGTRVRSTIFLQAGGATEGPGISVRALPGPCRGCLSCLKACPTGAVRVRDRRPEILAAQCIDCTECIAACQAAAFSLRELPGVEQETKAQQASAVVLPLAFLTGFAQAVGPMEALGALMAEGFDRVRFTEEWEAPLRSACLELAARQAVEQLPVITPLCPAVVNLIAVSFPSLLPHLAPYLSPVEAVTEAYRLEALTVVPACPAQQSLLEADSRPGRLRVVSPEALRDRIRPHLGACDAPEPRTGLAGEPARALRVQSRSTAGASRALRAGGMRHVQRILEAAEKGLLGGVAVLELTACVGGCFGSPLFPEDPFVARMRHPFLELGPEPLPIGAPRPEARASRRLQAIAARRGVRLDPDMARAIEKLSRIDELTKSLPGRDCGACGSPSCAALAEDIVLGRAAREACVFDGK